MPNAGSVRLHEAMGFACIGTHRDIGFKLGAWRDIEYWRLGLAVWEGALGETVPFAVFRETAGFADLVR